MPGIFVQPPVMGLVPTTGVYVLPALLWAENLGTRTVCCDRYVGQGCLVLGVR